MKNLAFWSRDHKTIARVLIAVCHILIFCAACYVGIGLQQNNLSLSPLIFWIFAALFILINILFSKSYASFPFSKKKLIDAFVLFTSFIMIVGFANQKNISPVTSYDTLQGSFLKKQAKVSQPGSKPSIRELKKQWKEFRKLTRGKGASTGGIILAILLGVGLSFLVLMLSCSIACNGSDALALFVLIGGLTGVFILCKAVVKATKKQSAFIEPGIPSPASP